MMMMMVGYAIEMSVQYPRESEDRKLSAHVASYGNDYNEYPRGKFLRVDRITTLFLKFNQYCVNIALVACTNSRIVDW